MWKTGHSLIKSKMKETGAPLAGEMSGHIFFKHWYGFDDALRGGPADRGGQHQRQTLTEIMDAMPKATATPELRFQVDEVRKFAIVEEVRDRLSENGARSTPPTACASARKTAGGCCVPSNTRTSSSPAPKRRISPGLDRASSGRSTSSSPLQASSALAPRTGRPRLRSRRGSARRP